MEFFFRLLTLSWALIIFHGCTLRDEVKLDKSNYLNEVQISDEGFLIFESWDSFINQINEPSKKIPEKFYSLNNIIRDLKSNYLESGEIEDLQHFYVLEENAIVPNYPYMAFTTLLDENMIIEIEGKLLKLDFDSVKESSNGSYYDLKQNKNIKIIPSSTAYSFAKKSTRSNYTCIGYLQIVQLYNMAYGTYVADDMGHPDPVIGTFRSDGGSLHYTGNSSLYGGFLEPFNSTANPHGYVAVQLELPCRDVYVTFTSHGWIEFVSVGENINCDFDGIPNSTGSLMNGCN